MKRARLSLLISLALAIPGLLMVWDLLANAAWSMGLLSPSGELAVRLMVLAMLPGPLVELVGTNRFLKGWLLIRRNLGVAAFSYSLLHLGFYVIDMTPEGIVSEFGFPGIWTGWLALVLLLIPASISFNTAVRRLGRRWKMLQRLVYPALFLALAHWLLLGWSSTPALIHVAPLALAWAARAWKRHRIRKGAFTA
ncbi:ferric reductase-like transmembrane domain-containing protein [Novosphingobium sp. BW1]|uniref:ferric reductase-like transmembrane domain-containing protein n=1 Tax=Novosphingobium sp. BW1 TaxID=2592621 RepID=UPI0011DE5F06|nr:ferric reductase-like transmembrane domain-containing protein [Novosphingobium sp. BW1]TYC90954.1 iron reductase [Novosphingobium sp. BW1]